MLARALQLRINHDSYVEQARVFAHVPSVCVADLSVLTLQPSPAMDPDQIPPGQPTPAMDLDQIPPGQPSPVVTALSQEADDLRAALVADLLRVEQEALLNEVAETLAYLNLELLSTSEAVTHIVAVVDDFRRRCAQILG